MSTVIEADPVPAVANPPSSSAPPPTEPTGTSPAHLALSALALASLAACGGGGGDGSSGADNPDALPVLNLPGAGGKRPAEPSLANRPSAIDAARFLTQATFGIQSTQQIAQTQQKGFALWLWEQFNTGVNLHTDYLDQQKLRNVDKKGIARATDENAILSEAARLGLRESISIIPPTPAVQLFLGALDIFALSSDYEGLPLCILEAYASGLPAVATTTLALGVKEMQRRKWFPWSGLLGAPS